MKATAYSYQLQTLRQLEKTQAKDLTEQAMTVYGIRIDTINAGPESEEVKERLRAAAERQWVAFMQRDMPQGESGE